MTATALVVLFRLLDDAAIPAWLDDGRGVDALLQTRTRSHKDADIILPIAEFTSQLRRRLSESRLS